MKELRKIIQDMNEHFNKEIEMLKKNQIETLEIKSSINQIKGLAESFNNGLSSRKNNTEAWKQLQNIAFR